MIVTINLCGVPVTVEYTPIPAEGDGWNDPHIPAHVEIDSLSIGTHEASELLEPYADEIDSLVADAHARAAEDARVDAYMDREFA